MADLNAKMPRCPFSQSLASAARLKRNKDLKILKILYFIPCNSLV